MVRWALAGRGWAGVAWCAAQRLAAQCNGTARLALARQEWHGKDGQARARQGRSGLFLIKRYPTAGNRTCLELDSLIFIGWFKCVVEFTESESPGRRWTLPTREVSIIQAIKNNGWHWRERLVGWKLGKNMPAAREKDNAMAPPAQAKLAAPLRAALYARFSSDLQKDISIERQFADLEKAAKRLGLTLDKRHYYSDYSQTATSLFDRPGLTRELLGNSAKGQFDVVLVEATDRLARNRADLFFLADQFKFNNTKIFTAAGEVSALQLTFDGHLNADFIDKLAMRVKSGHDQIARKGLIPGRAAYGYDCVDHRKGEDAGVKVINPDQAKVVVRIFEEYVTGKSPRQIAADLMRDGIPSPGGGSHWNFQVIVGGEDSKRRGLLHNSLYIGTYQKNRFYNVKNPSTGKVITRKANPDDLITVEVPHLRIVDQALWDAAHRLRKERGFKRFGASGQVQRAVVPRKQHLLAGLLRCAECNGGMIVVSTDRHGLKRVTCSAAHNRQSCSHSKSYNLAKLTKEAIYRMHKHLTDPEFLKEKAKEKIRELERLENEQNGEREAAQRQYDRLDVQIKKLVRLLADDGGEDMPAEILASLKAKEIERRGLEERLRVLGAETNVRTLHPAIAKTFTDSVDKLHKMLQDNPDDPECRMAFRNVIDTILVHRTEYNEGYEISLYARLSAIKGGIDLFPAPRSNKEIVAEQGLTYRSDRVGHETSCGTESAQGTPVFLGRWKAAA